MQSGHCPVISTVIGCIADVKEIKCTRSGQHQIQQVCMLTEYGEDKECLAKKFINVYLLKH